MRELIFESWVNFERLFTIVIHWILLISIDIIVLAEKKGHVENNLKIVKKIERINFWVVSQFWIFVCNWILLISIDIIVLTEKKGHVENNLKSIKKNRKENWEN